VSDFDKVMAAGFLLGTAFGLILGTALRFAFAGRSNDQK
jgi:hypothetical protein